MGDPRYQFPSPPFDHQPQDAPGTTTAMAPLPDHGEQTYKGNNRLENRVCIITGGDSGIGRAVAIALAREGVDIVYTYLNEEKDAASTAHWIEAAGRRALPIRMDQSSRSECDAVVQQCQDAFGRLDILINNAAFQRTYEGIESIPDDELDYTFRTNVQALFFFCRAALRLMQPGAAIINTTSIQAFDPGAYLAPYAASKAAITNFTLSFAKEAIEKGVRVNAVAPGPVWTPLIPSTMSPDKVKDFGTNTLLKRPAQPCELAPLYVFLASDAASYITGEIYGVTGGRKQF